MATMVAAGAITATGVADSCRAALAARGKTAQRPARGAAPFFFGLTPDFDEWRVQAGFDYTARTIRSRYPPTITLYEKYANSSADAT